MNELNAIRFLRAAISSEPTTLPDGRPEPGWCCTEHAVVASLAFRLSGVQSFLCTGGKVMIGGTRLAQVLDVIPHDFVVIGDPPEGIFDSSVSYDGIHGIPMRFAVHPDLAVGLMERKPDKEDFTREFQDSRKPVFALYFPKVRKPPNEHTLSWTSMTPFGLWLTHRYGSQLGLWGKAAWFTAEHFAGRIIFDSPQVDRAIIWDSIASSPNRDELILARLPKSTDET
jgi:hypothetical protein